MKCFLCGAAEFDPRDVPLSVETSLSCQNEAWDFGAQVKHMYALWYMISDSIKTRPSLSGITLIDSGLALSSSSDDKEFQLLGITPGSVVY